MEGTDPLQDDVLVLQCQQGDVAGFDRLVRRWQPPLLSYAYRLTGDWASAQDVVQDTWLVVIRGLVTLKDVTRFRAWLFRVASHKCQDHWRRGASKQRFAESLQVSKKPCRRGTREREANGSRLSKSRGRAVISIPGWWGPEG